MFRILFTESYQKREQKFFLKHPELKSNYGKTLKLLSLDPKHPSLRLHKLKGKHEGLSSVSINISYRIIIQFLLQDGFIVPVNIGTHDEVY